jgi:hypothetical protein
MTNLPLDTEEKQEVYRLAEIALSMRQRNPKSLLWRMRAKQALRRMEALWMQSDTSQESIDSCQISI